MSMDLRDTFPKELIELFISYMDVNTKRRLRATSKYWFSFIKIDEFKLFFANPKTVPDIVQHFSKYYDNISIGISLNKIVAPNYKNFPVEHFVRLTNLTSLEFDFPRSSLEWVEQASTLASLTNLQRISRIKLTSTLINLTSLNVVHRYYQSADPRYIPLYTNLVQLSMTDMDSTVLSLVTNPSRLTAFTYDAKFYPDAKVLARYSNLKRLHISDVRAYIDLTDLTQLENLEISFQSQTPVSLLDLFRLTQLTKLQLEISKSTRDLESISNLANLKHLTLLARYSSQVDYSFVSSLTALESFTPKASKSDIIQYQPLNLNKLTKLVTYGKVFDDSIGQLTTLLELYVYESADFNCEMLIGLRHLTKLYLTTQEPYLKNFTVLNQLTSLKWLSFWGGSQIDIHKDIMFKSLTNLEDLTLVCKVSQQIYNHMTSMTRLTRLTFNLPSEVWLTNTTLLTCLPLKQLVFQHQMYFVQRHQEPFYVKQLVQVCTKLPELEHLEVWKVSSEESIESLSVLTNLTYLALWRTRRVEGIHLTKLTSLQVLKFTSKKARNRYCKRGDFLTEKLTRLVSQDFN